MTAVNPTTNTQVTAALDSIKASLAAGYGSGATSTHHRQAIIACFAIATEDPRAEPNAVFDPEASYTKLGARGIEMALANYVKFLHDPLNEIAMVKASGEGSGSAYELPSEREAAARAMIVNSVDMMLAHVADPQYTEIWGIAEDTYTPTWVDANNNGIADADEPPMNVVAPVLSRSTNTLSVTNGSWTGSPDSYERIWYRDGEVLEGVTGTTYLAEDDAEAAIPGEYRVHTVAVNENGDSAPALSNVITIAGGGTVS